MDKLSSISIDQELNDRLSVVVMTQKVNGDRKTKRQVVEELIEKYIKAKEGK